MSVHDAWEEAIQAALEAAGVPLLTPEQMAKAAPVIMGWAESIADTGATWAAPVRKKKAVEPERPAVIVEGCYTLTTRGWVT